MRQIWILLLMIGVIVNTNAQQLSNTDIPAMVELIDEHLNLNDYQKKEVTAILTQSVSELQKVQALNKTDVEKLQLLQLNQKATRERLEVVLDHNQYKNYIALLDGGSTASTTEDHVVVNSNTNDNFNGIPKPSKGNTSNVVLNGSTASIADKLNFTGDKKSTFIKAYDNQERIIQGITKSGNLTLASGIDLLTSIITTDFKVLDLGGRSTYENYFQLRESGQLNGGTALPANQKVDISKVYQLYDLKQALELTDDQTDQFIRLLLKGEADKNEIRKQYTGSQRAQKLKQQEQAGLQSLQKLLTPAQLQKIAALLGK